MTQENRKRIEFTSNRLAVIQFTRELLPHGRKNGQSGSTDYVGCSHAPNGHDDDGHDLLSL